jgi:hypothetical protein
MDDANAFALECFERDASGKALRVTCHYVD